MNITERLSRLLVHIEDAMWEHEITKGTPIDLSNDGFRASIKIFAAGMLAKIWELQQKEGLDLTDRAAMSAKCGEEIRKLVKTYTDIETFDFYK
jgi:hypothetical protein